MTGALNRAITVRGNVPRLALVGMHDLRFDLRRLMTCLLTDDSRLFVWRTVPGVVALPIAHSAFFWTDFGPLGAGGWDGAGPVAVGWYPPLFSNGFDGGGGVGLLSSVISLHSVHL